MQTSPETCVSAQLRDLDGILSDYYRFLTGGQGDIQKAKLFNNTIQLHFIDIPLHEVMLVKVDSNKHASKLQMSSKFGCTCSNCNTYLGKQ